MAMRRLRKHLSAPGLLGRIRRAFDKIPDHRRGACRFSLSDALMSGLAVFGLKYPSLLNFDEGRNEAVIRHNLHTLYGVEQAPCDTQLRTILDPVDPQRLRGAFRAVHQQLRRDKVLEPIVIWASTISSLLTGRVILPRIRSAVRSAVSRPRQKAKPISTINCYVRY
jgi:hypothetical protein